MQRFPWDALKIRTFTYYKGFRVEHKLDRSFRYCML